MILTNNVLCCVKQNTINNATKEDLSKSKYYLISHLAREFLIKNNITKLPVPLNQIIKNNEWKFLKYLEAKKLNNTELNILMEKNLGFCLEIKDKYIIFFNEDLPIEKIRFVIAHEIGHIVLRHFLHGNKTLNIEKEANMFATRILMPIVILKELNIQTPNALQKFCNVEFKIANYRFNRLQLLKKRNKFFTDKNEIILYNQFKDFLENNKNS